MLETAADAPSGLAGAIAGCDAVVAMRYHAGLFAIRSGIPVIGLVYDPKVRHLFAAAGAEAYAVELGALRAQSPIPIAGGETNADLDEYLALFAERAFDVVQPDCATAEGLFSFA